MVKSMDVIVSFMNDEIREQVHRELAPCTDEEFLKRYFELDSEFEMYISPEFSMCLYEDFG